MYIFIADGHSPAVAMVVSEFWFRVVCFDVSQKNNSHQVSSGKSWETGRISWSHTKDGQNIFISYRIMQMAIKWIIEMDVHASWLMSVWTAGLQHNQVRMAAECSVLQ